MWEASGSCKSNKKYMEKNCRMACGLCEGKFTYRNMSVKIIID